MDANLSDFDVGASGEMNQIKFFAVSLLCRHFGTTCDSASKVRCLHPSSRRTLQGKASVSSEPRATRCKLEEAIQRHEATALFVARPDIDDNDLCLVEDCSLDLHLFWVKQFVKKFIAG